MEGNDMTMGKNRARRAMAIPAGGRRGHHARGLLVGACRRGLAVPAGEGRLLRQRRRRRSGGAEGGRCAGAGDRRADPAATPRHGSRTHRSTGDGVSFLRGGVRLQSVRLARAAVGWQRRYQRRALLREALRLRCRRETRPRIVPTPGPAPLPADPASGHDAGQADGLRTGEVVARIWIAPFVDADGVYREASHVRVVLKPAGWRFP